MNKLNLLLLVIIGFIYGCKGQSQSQRVISYKSEIIGTWVSQDDPSYRMEFTNQGKQREYIDGQLQKEEYVYSIETSCNSNSNNGFDIYLKRRQTSDDLNDYACDIINNLTTDASSICILSITNDRGQLELYTKIR